MAPSSFIYSEHGGDDKLRGDKKLRGGKKLRGMRHLKAYFQQMQMNTPLIRGNSVHIEERAFVLRIAHHSDLTDPGWAAEEGF